MNFVKHWDLGRWRIMATLVDIDVKEFIEEGC